MRGHKLSDQFENCANLYKQNKFSQLRKFKYIHYNIMSSSNVINPQLQTYFNYNNIAGLY